MSDTATTPKPPPGGLRERALTALVLAPAAIAGVLWMPTVWFAAALGLVFLVGVWEWTRLSGWQSPAARALLLATHAVLGTSVWFASDLARMQTVWCGVAFWFLAPWWLRHYHFGEQARKRSLAIKTMACALAIVPAWSAAVVLHDADGGPLRLLYVLLLVWCADSCAYFAGRRFGTTKLAPNISPGKTTAGVYGALAGCALFALGFGHFALSVPLAALAPFVALGVVTVVFSIIGDLLESLIKRHSQAKDSGSLFPGHGGVLDRFDSLFAALPIFVAGRQVLGS